MQRRCARRVRLTSRMGCSAVLASTGRYVPMRSSRAGWRGLPPEMTRRLAVELSLQCRSSSRRTTVEWAAMDSRRLRSHGAYVRAARSSWRRRSLAARPLTRATELARTSTAPCVGTAESAAGRPLDSAPVGALPGRACTVRVVRVAGCTAHPDVTIRANLGRGAEELFRERRLADAGLARDEDELTLSLVGPTEACVRSCSSSAFRPTNGGASSTPGARPERLPSCLRHRGPRRRIESQARGRSR